MAGLFDSESRGFGELIGRYRTTQLVVPRFQRGYSWQKEHIATFWDDIAHFHHSEAIKDNTARYFLGPVVVMPRKDRTLVLDGQQRLATATIAFSVLRNSARSIGSSAATDLARDIQRDFVEREEDDLSLQLNDTDRTYFERTVQNDPPQPASPTLRSHARIRDASEYMASMVNRELQGLSPSEAVQRIKDLKTTLAAKVLMVVISVNSEEDAYKIFETLNDRGLRLSVPDLLLNYLMQSARNRSERTVIRGQWTNMLENLERRDAARFLRHMWLSKYGDVKARGLFHEIKTYLARHKVRPSEFSEICDSECEAYTGILDINQRRLGNAAGSVEALVRHLEAHVALPVLLSGIRCLDQEHFARLSGLVVDLFVRHSLIANLNPYDLEDVLYRAARNIREIAPKKGNVVAYRKARDILAAVNPSDSVVEEATRNLLLKKSQARYIMAKIANHSQSPTREVETSNVTLEHIFPQRAPGHKWRQVDLLRPLIWHIGNLTLLSKPLNQQAARGSFREKIVHYRKSEIKLTQQIAKEYRNWTPVQIFERSTKLARVIIDVWRGPSKAGD